MSSRSDHKGLQSLFASRVESLADRESLTLPRPFLGIFLPNMFPQVPKHWHFFAGDVVGHWDTRQFDNATFDGVHERKIAHSPGEECSLDIT